MGKKPEKFKQTVLLLATILRDYQYAFRGTASLVLHGVDMNVDDVDILCDKQTALACNQLLTDYLHEEVRYQESDQFKSYFGKFEVNHILVEVMGEWQVRDKKGLWSEPFDASQRTLIQFNGKDVYVTPIEQELAVFAKMGRWNAYHKIRKCFDEQKRAQPKLLP